MNKPDQIKFTLDEALLSDSSDEGEMKELKKQTFIEKSKREIDALVESKIA
jgi:hypothetical protein